MASGSQGPRVGRPSVHSPEERETLILDAMERVIARSGVRGATMTAIAREAAMSKRTLYAVFDDREAMFDAWVRRTRAFVVRPLKAEDEQLPLDARLKKLLRREAVGGGGETADVRLQVVRALIAESAANPALVSSFLLQGPETARSIIADELRRGVARGELEIRDIEAAAHLLLDMAHALSIDALLAPERVAAKQGNSETRLDLAVGIFLHGARKAQG